MEPVSADTVDAAERRPLVVRGRPVDGAGALGLIETVEPDSWVAWHGPAVRITAAGRVLTTTAEGPRRFAEIKRRARTLFADRQVPADLPAVARPRLFGGFAFHDGAHGRHGDPDWSGFPDARFVLPEVSVIEQGGDEWLVAAAIGPDAPAVAERRLEKWADRLCGTEPNWSGRPPGIADRRQLPDREDWTTQVRAALDRVRRGTLRKVVLAGAQSVAVEKSVSVPAVLDRLEATYPECYRFAIAPAAGTGTFFGVTPERLVTATGRAVRTAALAGSTGRGDTESEDVWLGDALCDSPKDSHEHELVVEAIRDQLEAVGATVETGERTLRKLASVQHLQTPISARLSSDHHVLDLVEALHPTPAVGGLPPDAALTAIRETEAFDRGWYAAPVGWFDASGDGTFAVGIRSAVARDRQATLFAGAGIVTDSDPAAEWDEIQLKYRPILDALR